MRTPNLAVLALAAAGILGLAAWLLLTTGLPALDGFLGEVRCLA